MTTNGYISLPRSNRIFIFVIVVSLVPKLIETVKHKLSDGTKILPLGRDAKIFRKSFSTTDSEKLLHATRSDH